MTSPSTCRRTRVLAAALMAATFVAAAGCGQPAAPATGPEATAPATAATGPSAADAAFVLHMLPHHERALQVGGLMAGQGSDPRVRAFGARIVAEQTPEKDHLQSWVTQLRLSRSPGDAAMAAGYVDDAALARLRGESGPTFDRDALLSSAGSETGAAAMSATELDGGRYAPARELAAAISTAPSGEIPALRDLASRLG